MKKWFQRSGSKGFVRGFVAGALAMFLLSGATSAIASARTEDITVTFRNIRLVINGEQVTPRDAAGNVVEPFIWQDTTYLPIRAVADALGMEASWDGSTSTAYLTDREPGTPAGTPSPAASPAPAATPIPSPASNGENNFGTPLSFPGVATIDHASEDDMTANPDAPRFSWIEEGSWIMFSFEEAVYDIVFVSASATGFDYENEAFLFELGQMRYEIGNLAAGEPFFIRTYGHFGTMPAQAIGLTYTDGIRYYIPFDESQMDGSMTFHKQLAFTFDE